MAVRIRHYMVVVCMPCARQCLELMLTCNFQPHATGYMIGTTIGHGHVSYYHIHGGAWRMAVRLWSRTGVVSLSLSLAKGTS